jgi:hypothetical protein
MNKEKLLIENSSNLLHPFVFLYPHLVRIASYRNRHAPIRVYILQRIPTFRTLKRIPILRIDVYPTLARRVPTEVRVHEIDVFHRAAQVQRTPIRTIRHATPKPTNKKKQITRKHHLISISSFKYLSK